MKPGPEGTRELVGQFLALPATTLPGAMWMSDRDQEDAGDVWEHLRDVVRRRLFPAYIGRRVQLQANLDGWRAGRVIVLPVNGRMR